MGQQLANMSDLGYYMIIGPVDVVVLLSLCVGGHQNRKNVGCGRRKVNGHLLLKTL